MNLSRFRENIETTGQIFMRKQLKYKDKTILTKGSL